MRIIVLVLALVLSVLSLALALAWSEQANKTRAEKERVAAITAEKQQALNGLIEAYSEADREHARNRRLCELLTSAGYEIPVDLLPCDPVPNN